MTVVTLSLRDAPPGEVEAPLAPDRLTGSERELGRVPLRIGHRRVDLGEVFRIRTEAREGVAGPELRLDTGGVRIHGLGAGMAAGTLVVEGDAGDRLGARMSGGRIRVRGSCGDHAATEMSAGTIRVEGDAGDRTGGAYTGGPRGMTGGTVLVRGSAGRETGAAMRRGLIAVGGACAERPAFHAIAGTVVVFGKAGVFPGLASKRGSVILHDAAEPPPSYRLACVYDPPYVRLLLRHLAGPLVFPVPERVRAGRYARWVGDFTEVGKAEILSWRAS